jgi:hypothetical protein
MYGAIKITGFKLIRMNVSSYFILHFWKTLKPCDPGAVEIPLQVTGLHAGHHI